MSNAIDLKTIKDILKYKFYIPSYQRGYRWDKQQVTDLLEDIWDFSQRNDLKKDEFYCLQPIVVKNKVKSLEDEKWEIIDGQQRLTTIYIILTYIKNNILPNAAIPFTLEFETRKNSEEFLRNINENEKEKNIDYYYIFNALKNIEEWFKGKEDETTTVIEIYNKLLNQTKIIWYQVNESIDSIDIFTRINLGKIPLTNAELIKALFLKKDNFSSDNNEKIHIKQLEIANEWDRIEYSLQNNEFWYFLCNGSKEYETRIEFIFNIMAVEINETFEKPIVKQNNEYFSFLVFNKLFKEDRKEEELNDRNHTIDRIWLKIKKYYMTLEEWFNNRELYHLVGYIVSTGDVKIEQIKKETKNMTKTQLNNYLNSKIKASIYSQLNIEEWEYDKHKKIIKNTLLLFNIISIISNKSSNIRFPFDRYKIEDWDIEHIHAVNSKMPNDKKSRLDWLESVKNEIDDNMILTEINRVIDTGLILDGNSFEKIYKELLNKYSDDDEINDISNLTLLDAKTNRSYKNSIFPIKRKIILENDRQGTFIPICTKNVFLKYYSEDIKQMNFWGKGDRGNYLSIINQVLATYLHNEGDSNGRK